MYCKHCGAQNVDGSTFCANCGQSLTDEVVEQKPAQPAVEQTAAPVEEGPTGLKKIFYLIGSICSFVALVLLFGLFFGSGYVLKGFDLGGMGELGELGGGLTTLDVFKADGIWKIIINGLKGGKDAIANVIGDLFTMIMILVGIVVLVVYLIIGIIKFVKAMKGEDYRGVTRTAIKAYGTFATIELVSLSLHAADGIALNDVALAALCLCAILIGANFALHYVANLKQNLGLKKLLTLVFTVALVVVGVIVAALAAGPVINYNGTKSNFFQRFIHEVLSSAAGDATLKRQLFSVIGWVSSFALVVLGVGLIQKMFLKIADLVDGKENKKSGFFGLIVMFILGLALVVATYLYAKEFNVTKVDGALPIVIMVFSFVGAVVSLLNKKLFEK